jgi:hypothetical protein
MTSLKICSISILIASTLLLGAASKAAPQDQNPRPTVHRAIPKVQKRESTPTATKTEPIFPVADNRFANIHQDGDRKDPKKSDWITRVDVAQTILQILFTAITTLATVYLAKFTYRLVTVTADLHRATQDGTEVARENVKAAKAAAKAAEASLEFTKNANEQNLRIAAQSSEATRQSAEIAQLALTAERPYLVVEKASLEGVIRQKEKKDPVNSSGILDNIVRYLTLYEELNEPSRFIPSAVFTFKNYGKGAAIIDELVARISLVTVPPPEGDFSSCMQFSIEREAVGPGDEWNETRIASADFISSEADLSDLTKQVKTLIVYGCVKYRDVSKTRPEGYRTEFYWIFEPPRPFDLLKGKPVDPADFVLTTLTLPHGFSRGPKARNQTT